MSIYYFYLTSIPLMNFGTHEKAKFWNYSLNEKGPSEYTCGSNYIAWFTCDICKHDFQKDIKHITRSTTKVVLFAVKQEKNYVMI